MKDIQDGFHIEVNCAMRSAREGNMQAMARHLAGAHCLALYGDTTLLPLYGKADAECWQEYEQWKTTNGAAA